MACGLVYPEGVELLEGVHGVGRDFELGPLGELGVIAAGDALYEEALGGVADGSIWVVEVTAEFCDGGFTELRDGFDFVFVVADAVNSTVVFFWFVKASAFVLFAEVGGHVGFVLE